jgi:hypothetical protein
MASDNSSAEKQQTSVEQVENVTQVDSLNDDYRIAEDAASAKPSPWTPRMFALYAVLFPCFLCSCLNGFDG